MENLERQTLRPLYISPIPLALHLACTTIGGKRLGCLLRNRLVRFSLLHHSLNDSLFVR